MTALTGAIRNDMNTMGHEMTRQAERPAELTPREAEILRLLARGLLNKQIARLLGIAPKTVGNHVEHIYAKIGVSSRAAAGFFAAAHGLISFADTTAGPSAAAAGTLQARSHRSRPG